MRRIHIIPIFRPLGRVCVDILPDLSVIFFIADHMLVIRALPKLYAASAVCKAFQRGDKQGQSFVRRGRRPRRPAVSNYTILAAKKTGVLAHL